MAFPAPIEPDYYDCSAFFALKELNPLDCQQAFNMLPVGTDPIWFKNNPEEGDPHGLPFNVGHGTCRIRFQAAGPAAERLDTVPFVPNQMRDMAGWVYDECIESKIVRPGSQGGYVSKDISNTIDYLTDPDSDIADFLLEWPLNTSFFTVTVWDGDPDFYFNPGNNDPVLAEYILDLLDDAVIKAKVGSDAKFELQMRYEHIERAKDHMQESEEGIINWWDYYPPEIPLSLVNVTSPCNGTISGPVGSSCSRLQQSDQ